MTRAEILATTSLTPLPFEADRQGPMDLLLTPQAYAFLTKTTWQVAADLERGWRLLHDGPATTRGGILR